MQGEKGEKGTGGGGSGETARPSLLPARPVGPTLCARGRRPHGDQERGNRKRSSRKQRYGRTELGLGQQPLGLRNAAPGQGRDQISAREGGVNEPPAAPC